NGWWDGDYRSTLYNHYLTPNARRPDCWPTSPPHNPAWKAARSLHPGGVNVLYCDGHVGFVKDSISPVAWRSLATRNGAAVVSADAYKRATRPTRATEPFRPAAPGATAPGSAGGWRPARPTLRTGVSKRSRDGGETPPTRKTVTRAAFEGAQAG